MGGGGAAVEVMHAGFQRTRQGDTAGTRVELGPALNRDAGALLMADGGLYHEARAIAQLPAFATFLRLGRQKQGHHRSDDQRDNPKKPAFQRHVR